MAFNTLRECGFERFADPQKPLELVTPMAGAICSLSIPVIVTPARANATLRIA